jgi:tetratricopeptide (TPR) repeat protein
MGRHDEALRRILHAETLEPLALSVQLSVVRCYYFARRFDQAHDAITGLLKTEPEHALTIQWQGRVLCAMGRGSESVAALERLTSMDPRPYARSLLAQALAAAGRAEEAEDLCVELEGDLREGRAGPLSLVRPLAWLGQVERSLELLREAVRLREPFVPWLAVDPCYDPLRELSGFRDVLRELRLDRGAVEIEGDTEPLEELTGKRQPHPG